MTGHVNTNQGLTPPLPFARAEGERLGVSDWSEPKEEDVAQVTGYADDLKRRYPELAIRRHVLYTAGAAAYRFFTLD